MKKWMIGFLALALLAGPVAAQKTKKAKGKDATAATAKTPRTKSISSIVKKCDGFEGLFAIYQDTANGKAYLKIKEEQLGKEFIYFSHVEDGVSDAGFFRGSYRGSRIFSVRKHFNRIEFVQENTSFYFDEENPLSRSASANINRPVLVSQEIIAENKAKTEYLIRAEGVFLTESLQQIKRSMRPGEKPGDRFSIGKLSKTKSKYRSFANYPENTDVLVEYVYQNDYPKRSGSSAVTDPRYISVLIRHSLIQVPDNDFQPRYEDPRVGYFTHQVTDMTSPSATPYKDVIHRWNLVKKDPEATLSEPVEPIVWWIENTTPVDLRDVIRDGVLRWNEAFEEAGFQNAVQVKIQPDDAEWDAGDIRYNVLRWTSSPSPRFGGYGPSFVNPRTGQILGADIMLEYIYLTNRLRSEHLFDLAALDQETPTDTDLESGYCDFSLHMHHANLFGMHVLAADGFGDIASSEFIKESIYRLVLHEVGHTLGLNHNFMASQLHSPEEIHDRNLTADKGLTGSVMEYPGINVARDRAEQGQFFDVKPGLYDRWAIEFGYHPGFEEEDRERDRMENLMSRSTEPELAFGNDADDMRSPGKGIDPRRMIYDMTDDPVAYSTERILLVNDLMPKLPEKTVQDGQSYHELRNAYLIMTSEYSRALSVISRQVGGVYVDRAFAGQPGATQPYIPVPEETQAKALKALNDYAFAPTAFQSASSLYNYLQIQRRGFSLFRVGTEDPKIHDRVLRVQKGILDQLLHKRVLKRITDSELYGNTYTLPEMMTGLTDGIFKADLRTSVNSMRQNLQGEYVKRLSKVIGVKSTYHHGAKAMAHSELMRLRRLLRANPGQAAATKAHRQYLLAQIDQALDPK